MKKIIIPADALKAAIIFAEQLPNAKRPNLDCVHVEATATQVRITSTNGHIGLIQQYQVKNENVVRETVLMPVGDFLEAIDESTQPFALLLKDKGVADLVTENGVHTFQNVGGVYPDLTAVIPETSSGEPGQFDPEYLARFAEAALYLHTDLEEDQKPAVSVLHNGAKGIALLRFGTNPHAVGIASPVTPETPFTAAPAWVAKPMHVSGTPKDGIVITGQSDVTTEEDDLFGSKPSTKATEPEKAKQPTAAPKKRRQSAKKAAPAADPVNVAEPEADDCSDLF